MLFGIDLHTQYEIDCYRDGQLLWTDGFQNLVTVVGKNQLLDACFFSGAVTPTWFIGLVGTTSFTGFDEGDTMASHAGWVEAVPYSNATRPAYVPAASAAGSMSNAASRALFTINATKTLEGAFLVNIGTKSGTLGVLYGEGAFVTPRNVISGDVLSIKITLTD